MTPDERSLLTGFLSDLGQTRGVAKDPEADRMIADAVGANPDAVYLVVQHAILSDQALHATQAQLQDLQQQAPPPTSTSFLPARNLNYVPVSRARRSSPAHSHPAAGLAASCAARAPWRRASQQATS